MEMNREIKFRAFDKEGNSFTNEPIAMIYPDDWFVRYGYHMNPTSNSNRYVFMQFTGLKDKNGKEIYEGDIIREIYFPLGANPNAYEYSHIAVIEYIGNSFGRINKISEYRVLDAEKCASYQVNKREQYKHPTEGANWFSPSLSPHRIEVIGNIYETPIEQVTT